MTDEERRQREEWLRERLTWRKGDLRIIEEGRGPMLGKIEGEFEDWDDHAGDPVEEEESSDPASS